MQLAVEIAIAAWSVVSVGLSVWTYNDAWMLAFSRGWAAVSLILGPVGFGIYMLRSRVAGMKKPAGQLPGYESRQVEEAAAPKHHNAAPVVSSGGAAKSIPAGHEFESARLSQGLPHCPKCGTAVSYYDVKCLRCGQLIKPAVAGSSF